MSNNNDNNQSVLSQLRALMPARVLSLPEAMQRAELQAARLLALYGIEHGPVPSEVVTEAPRIRTASNWDLPVSGSAHWDGSDWIITLNASEPVLRQRFSLLHEYKHIIVTRTAISSVVMTVMVSLRCPSVWPTTSPPVPSCPRRGSRRPSTQGHNASKSSPTCSRCHPGR